MPIKNIHFTFDKDLSLAKKDEISKDASKDVENESFALAKYSSLGYYLLTPLLLGVFFGLFLDRIKNVSPWGILLGIFFGTIGTFYNLYRMTRDN